MLAPVNLPYPASLLRRLALGVLALVACVPAAADVTESLAYRYYSVTPHWAEPLWRSVIKASPIRENGKTFMGHTAWTVKWDTQWEKQANGSCAMAKVRTHLHWVITLPQAVLSEADEQARFDAFVKALRAHELDHVDIARDAAREIDRRLQRMPSMASCDQLEDAANTQGQLLLDEARRRGVEYDLKTEHGKSQGAVLN
jgi:predicted secreted Zn-dependent protease